MHKTKVFIVCAYFGVLIFLGMIMVVATQFDPTAQNSILASTTEAFKIVVSAFVGALSAMLGNSK